MLNFLRPHAESQNEENAQYGDLDQTLIETKFNFHFGQQNWYIDDLGIWNDVQTLLLPVRSQACPIYQLANFFLSIMWRPRFLAGSKHNTCRWYQPRSPCRLFRLFCRLIISCHITFISLHFARWLTCRNASKFLLGLACLHCNKNCHWLLNRNKAPPSLCLIFLSNYK